VVGGHQLFLFKGGEISSSPRSTPYTSCTDHRLLVPTYSSVSLTETIVEHIAEDSRSPFVVLDALMGVVTSLFLSLLCLPATTHFAFVC